MSPAPFFGSLTVGLRKTKVLPKINDENKSRPSQAWSGPQCGNEETHYTLRIIPSGRNTEFYPKWIMQIKEVCDGCGRYRRFAPQTELIVTRFNERLQSIPVRAK